MSTSPSADPYRPPALLTEEAAPSDRRRPGWFVTICVIAIALGGLGFLNGIYKVVEVTVGDPLARVMESPAGDELEAPAMKFENAVREVTVRYRPALLLLALVRRIRQRSQ